MKTIALFDNQMIDIRSRIEIDVGNPSFEAGTLVTGVLPV